MNVTNFKLKDDGYGGLTYGGTSVIMKGNAKVYQDIGSNTIHLPITREIRMALGDLKYHFLWLTSYMHDELSEFIEGGSLKDLKIPKSEGLRQKLYMRCYSMFESLEVTGITKTVDEEIILTGKILTISSKRTIGMSTPLIREVDDYFEYEKLLKICNHCLSHVSIFVQDEEALKVMDAKEYYDHKTSKDEKLAEEVKSKNPQQLREMYMKELEKTGHIVIPPENINETVEANAEAEKPKEKKKTTGMPATAK